MLRDKFFGRKDYLDILERRAIGLLEGYRQNVAIVGDELIGKTALIFQFLNRFCDNRFIMIYIEVRPESLANFVKRFIGVLLYNFLINSGLPLREDLDFLIEKSQKYAPRTIERIGLVLNAVSKRKNLNIFSELFSLPETIKQETGKSCVVILDEFHNLEKLGIKNLYREWSKLLISQKNTMFIITSSLKFKTKAILSRNLSLLFGNFELINIEPFDIKTSEDYLEERMASMNLDIGLRNFIVHFTGGYPFYLEVISDQILRSKNYNMTDILEDLLFAPCGILNQRFSNYIKRFFDSSNTNDYISILYLISSGKNKTKDIAHILHKPSNELSLRINHLLELDTIARSGDFLKINDRVFSFWLKFVYQEKLHSLTFDAKNQREVFRESLNEMIKDFYSNARKPILERMSELLHLFEDETIQIERKKIRLCHFREIKPLEFNTDNLKNGLIGRSNDSLWIMAIKQDILTEEDIAEFAQECRRYRHKLQRKIIITLRDIDANTRLKALEEKIWTWDINNLNQILDFFSKPWVVA